MVDVLLEAKKIDVAEYQPDPKPGKESVHKEVIKIIKDI